MSVRTALLVAALSVLSFSASADSLAERFLPNDSLVKEWWQLYLSIPNPVREQLAESADACGLGQHGSIWFLTTVSAPVETTTRRCTVPYGATLFVPVVSAVCSPFPGETLEENVQLCRELVDPFNKLSLTVDGKNRSNLIERRAQSVGFRAWNPEDNFWDTPEEDVPAGMYLTVAEGQYALVEGLAPGKHTIRARASSTRNTDVPKFDAIFEVTVARATSIEPK
jgi:hypothetical protein